MLVMKASAWFVQFLLLISYLLLHVQVNGARPTNTHEKECFAVELAGRMGNLMFEYASLVGLCVARRQDYRSCAYVSNLFNASAFSERQIPEFVREFNISQGACQLNPASVVQEASYRKKLHRIPSSSLVAGWFHTWKYFHPRAAHVVRRIYTVSHGPSLEAEAFIMSIRRQQPPDYKLIAVHVRVGDKINVPGMEKRYDQWSLSGQYYKRAVTLMQLRHPRSALVVFSGGGETPEALAADRKWARDLLGNLTEHMYFDQSHNPFTAMRAIGLCDAIVVAQSTFSWWAAYLSNTLEVVVPYHWLRAEREVGKSPTITTLHLPWWSVLSQNQSEERIVGWNPLIEYDALHEHS